MPLCEECIKGPAPATSMGGNNVCKGCGSMVVGEATYTALGCIWHRRCFKCAVCNVELWNQSFFTKNDGRAYCRTHGQ